MNQLFFAVCNDSYILREVRSLNELSDGSRADGEISIEIVDTIPDPGPDLFDLHHHAQLQVFARRFVGALPVRLRKIALGFYWEEKTKSQIAQELGISRSAVSQAINRISELGRQAIASSIN